MRIRYRKMGNSKWKSSESSSDLIDYLCGMTQRETLEVKWDCDHDKTYVDNGIRICKECGEQLEVTSFRD